MYPTAAGSLSSRRSLPGRPTPYSRPTAPTPPALPRSPGCARRGAQRPGWGVGDGRFGAPRPAPPGSADSSAQLCAALHHPRRNNSGRSVAALAWSSALPRGARLGHGDGSGRAGRACLGLENGTRNGRVECESCGRRAWKRCLFPPPRTRAGVPGLPNTSLRLL